MMFKKINYIGLSIIFLFSLSACENDDSGAEFQIDFDYTLVNENLVRFENRSTGEYYSLNWDFANGQTEETTEKRKKHYISYPVAGDYDVSLQVLDFVGNTQTITKTVTIANTEFQIGFSAQVSPTDPNIVTLTNQTLGGYDSFTWEFRGKEIQNIQEYEAYFPFTGNYIITLVVDRGGVLYREEKSVSILSDDPDYANKLTLVWSDEFDGNSLNTDNWTYETGASGWGNNELQNYTAGENADVTDGNLTITARKLDDNTQVGSYSSSRIVSQGKQEFQYGRLEVRAKLPSGTGIWPAIWMLGGNFSTAGWPTCGEIDIMEYVGYQPNTVHSTIHTSAGFGGDANGRSFSLPTAEEEFHNYGIVWTSNKIQFYIDTPDNVIHEYAPATKTASNWPFDQPAFFILNIAVGGSWGGREGVDNSIFPQTMDIDYVRVYQEAP